MDTQNNMDMQNNTDTQNAIDTKKKRIILLVITVAFALYAGIKLISGIGSLIFGLGGIGGSSLDSVYIAAAKEIVAENLKNPSGATVHEAEIYEKDDYGRAIVYLDVSAQNGFGGYERDDFYVCITRAESDGSYSHIPNFDYVTGKEKVSFLKTVNNFGEPKEE